MSLLKKIKVICLGNLDEVVDVALICNKLNPMRQAAASWLRTTDSGTAGRAGNANGGETSKYPLTVRVLFAVLLVTLNT